jgi:YggT family protein
MYILGYPLLAAVNILSSLLLLYMFVIIAAAVVSWVNPDPLNPIVRFLRTVTDPVLDKLRPYIPSLGGLDLTPLLLLILLAFVRDGLLPAIAAFARDLL